MNRADCKALRSAALELLSWAISIRESHTLNDDWGDEHAAKASYEKHMRLAKRLRAIANDEQKKLGMNATDLLLAHESPAQSNS